MTDKQPTNLDTVMIPGERVKAEEIAPPTKKLFKDDLKVVSAYDIKPLSRDGGPAEFAKLDAKQLEGQVIELEFENGQKLCVSGEWLIQKLDADKQAAKTRGLVTEPDTQVRIPHAFALPGPTRGVIGQAILKGLKVIGIDPASEIAKGVARVAVRRIEDQLVKGTLDPSLVKPEGDATDRSGWLFPFDDNVQLKVKEQVKDAKTLAGVEPYLLFIHGTASSSNGSFGKLANTEEWKQLRADYGARILAFEHRSLSVSPIKNALDLLDVLPDGATLHLVSHSRGGLVGELLCLSQVARDQVRLEELLQVYGKAKDGDKEAKKARAEERALLSRLWEVSAGKRLNIERFVRVACPARGTTWLANNLDYFFSALLHAIELVPGLSENPIYDFIKVAMTALVKLRANPAELPGLEAMMPSSPLIGFLNQPDLTTTADLAVIAGRSGIGGSVSGSLLTLLTNTVLLEKNDWVVNTRAMDGGIKRQQAWRFFDEGSDVNHFSYFFNPNSRRRLAMRLALKVQPFEQTKGFDKLTQRGGEKIDVAAARGGPVSRGGKAADVKGTVFVLPGIMGSELKYQGKAVWLNYPALLRGDMSTLVIDHTTPDVQPEGLMASDYKRLVEELSRNYRVIPFAYDWRQSVKDAGENLVRAVRGVLADSQGKPIHLVAHSMGGLVARSMIVQDGELWRELIERQGRLIMLGTPNHGAPQIARMLLGEEKLLKMLALLDFEHDITELLKILRDFPGVLDLLPEEYFDLAAWEQLNKPLRKDHRFPVPNENALANAKSWRARLNRAAAGPAQMIYVAGFAERTPLDLRRAPDGVLEVTETSQGDGRVPYALGKLDNVPTYYAYDVVHGDLADHPPLFPAIGDLLEQGRTERLPQQPRLDRTAAPVTIFTRAEEFEPVFPTEEELQDAVSGGRSRLTVSAVDSAYMVQVSVMHGHLRYAKYPVAVGHYTGDSIMSAEAELDTRLGGRLSERHRLNRYPGPQDTTAIVLMEPDHQPPGALVIGLGEVGEIRADVVRQGVTTAALEYALAVAARPARADEPGVRSAAFSSLMIGTYGGHALTVAESVEAILTGVVNANRILQAQKMWDKVRIDRVELVELYEDVAIQAIQAAQNLRLKPPADFGDQVGIELTPSRLNPQRGGRYQRPVTQYANDWWRRIMIIEANKQANAAAIYQSFPELLRQLRAAPEAGDTLRNLIEKVLEETARVPAQRAYLIELINCLLEIKEAARKVEYDGLEFTVLTDRARAEGLMQAAQRLWVDQLVRGSISRPVFDPSLAATLFELLVLNELKSQSENTLLVLDRDAAQYPWELLAERTQTDKPIVTQIGLLRQFKTPDFRSNPIPARQRNALVIGDATNHGLPELFGAQDEAQRVAAALRPAQFEVTELIKPNGLKVITELFAREYQIIHIAAHGIFDPNESKRQGVVLGPDQYLTTTEIVNLRAVPKLVFINCCHLGQLDSQAQSDQQRLNTEYPHRLAASIAEELIKIGVKAVIAAGWAVDDAAALTFAEEFYREMLSGMHFGDAVLRARQKTFQLHGKTNTWGAYQCYGTPSFTLSIGPSRDGGSPSFHSRRDFRDELKSIAEQPEAADPLNNRHWSERLTRVEETIPADLRDGEVLADLGDAWHALGDFTKAIAAYKLAVTKADGRASLRVIERLANLQSRLVESKWRLAEADRTDDIDWSPAQAREAGQSLRKAADSLTWLNTEFGETAERLSLLGRVYKSLALLAPNLPDAQKKLQLASAWYEKASARCVSEGQARDNYTTFNWLACRLLLGKKSAPKTSRSRKAVAAPTPTDFLGLLDDCVTTARKKLAVKEDFWVRVAIPDALVLRNLYVGTLPDNKEQIIAEYQVAFGTGARPSEVDSALSQLDFLREMLGRQRGQAAVVKALLEIKARLLVNAQIADR